MLKNLLQDSFEIVPIAITQVQGGFSAKAYRVETKEGFYFLKVYDKSLTSAATQITRMDDYLPVLGQLCENTQLSRHIIKPIPSVYGCYKVETSDYVILLFEYVFGRVPGEEGLNSLQIAELANTLALLHRVSDSIPFNPTRLQEDGSLVFCEQLNTFLKNIRTENQALNALLCPRAQMLRCAVEKALYLHDNVRQRTTSLVLCHSDAHSNNIILSDRLVLVDWEDLHWAPPEADLFIYAWHQRGKELLQAYTAARPGYPINQELLQFYLLRRRLEDVWFDVQRLIQDSPDEVETAKLLHYTALGLQLIPELL